MELSSFHSSSEMMLKRHIERFSTITPFTKYGIVPVPSSHGPATRV